MTDPRSLGPPSGGGDPPVEAGSPPTSEPAAAQPASSSPPRTTAASSRRERDPATQAKLMAGLRWGLMIVGVAVVAVLIYWALAAFVPRWWAQSVGRQVDGRLGPGIVWGLVYGIVFTVLPVLVLAQVRRPNIDWPYKIAIVAGAVVLTAPNLITLSIALGVSRAAQAADRVLDVQAPGFRYATLWGVVIGALLGVAIVTVSILFTRRGREIRNLQARLRTYEPRKR